MLKPLCVGTTLMLSAPLAVRMAGAQSPQHAQVGAVSGLIFDSLLTNAPLAGAEVTIVGRETTAITDARGAFSLSGVPAGAVTLRFYHACTRFVRHSAHRLCPSSSRILALRKFG